MNIQEALSAVESIGGAEPPSQDVVRPEFTFDALSAKYDQEQSAQKPVYPLPKTWFGEARFGLSRGIDSLQQMIYGGAALATTGELHQKFLSAAKQQDEEIQAAPASVPTHEGVDSFDHFMRYFAGGLGEMAPQIGESVASGAIGAAIGSASAPGPGTAIGAIGGLIEKQAIKNLIKSSIQETAKTELKSLATGVIEKKALSETAKGLLVNETKNLGAKYGAMGAVAANSWGQESASIYTDLENDPNIPETDKRLTSLIGGFIAAIPDAGFEGWIASKFFKGAKSVGKYQITDAANYAVRFMKTYGKELIKVAPAEGAQEYAQTLIEEAAKNYADPNKRDAIFNFTPEQKTSFVDAMFKGAIGGVLGGGIAAVAETPRAKLPAYPDSKVRQDERDIQGKIADIVLDVPVTPEDQRLSEITKRQDEINTQLIQPEITEEQKATLQEENVKLDEEANKLLGVEPIVNEPQTTETPLVSEVKTTKKQPSTEGGIGEQVKTALNPFYGESKPNREVFPRSETPVESAAVAAKRNERDTLVNEMVAAHPNKEEGKIAKTTIESTLNDEALALFANQGVSIRKAPANEGFGVGDTATGRINFYIPSLKRIISNAEKMARSSQIHITGRGRIASLQAIDSVLIHEIAHVAHYVANRQDWIKEGRPGSFIDYNARKLTELGKSMRLLAKEPRLNPIFKSIQTTPGLVYHYGMMMSKDGKNAVAFGKIDDQTIGTEVTRMAVELARTGKINEFTEALVQAEKEAKGSFKEKISDFLKRWVNAIAKVRDILAALINPETSSKEFQTVFNNINKVLDHYGVLVNESAKSQQEELKKANEKNKDLRSETVGTASEKAKTVASFRESVAGTEAKTKGKSKDIQVLREEASQPARAAEPKQVAYHVPTSEFTEFATPNKRSIRNSRGLFGHFFSLEKPKEGNLAGERFDLIKKVDISGLKLFDWDAYGTGSWEKFSATPADRNFESKVLSVLETKNNLIKKGYDGIIVNEIGFGTTVVVFDESKGKIPFIRDAISSSPNDYVPALQEPSGVVIVGQKGELHKDIKARQSQAWRDAEVLADVEGQPKATHGFVELSNPKTFLSREQVSEALGEKTPMQSERLLELQLAEEAQKENIARASEPQFTKREEQQLNQAAQESNRVSNQTFGEISPKKAERKKVQGQLLFEGLTPQSASYLTRTKTQTVIDAQKLVNENGGAFEVAKELRNDPQGKKFKITEDILNEKDFGPNARLRAVYDNVADQLNNMIEHLNATEGSIAIKSYLYDLREAMVRQPMWMGNEAGSFNAQTGFQRLVETGQGAIKTFKETMLGAADQVLGKKAKEKMESLSNQLNSLMDVDNSFQLVSHPKVISILRRLQKLMDKSKFASGYRKQVVQNVQKLKAIVHKASARAAEALAESDDSFLKADKFIEYLIKEMSGSAKEQNAPDEHSVVLSALSKMTKQFARELGLIEESPKFVKLSDQEKMLAILKNETLYTYFINGLRDEFIEKYNDPQNAQYLFAKLANRAWSEDLVKGVINEKMREINTKFSEIVKSHYQQGEFTTEAIKGDVKKFMESQGVTNEHLIEQLINDIESQMEENINAAREKFFTSTKTLKDFLKSGMTTLAEAARQHSQYSENMEDEFADYLINEFYFPEQEANQLASVMQKEFNTLIVNERKTILERFVKNAEREKPENSKKLKGAVQKILELSNLGVMRSEKIYQALQEQFALPPYKETTVQRIQELGDQIGEAKSDRQKDILRQQLSDFIASQKGLSTTSSYLSWMYFSMLSGLSTHLVNIGGNATNLLGYLAVESVKNPRQIPRMLSAMMRAANGSAKLEAKYSWFTGMQMGKDGNKYFSSKNPLELSDVFFTSDTIREKFGDKLADKDIQLAGFVHKIARGIKANYVGRSLVATDIYFYKIAKEMAYAARTEGELAGTPEQWDSARNEARADMLSIGKDPDGKDKLEFQVTANAIFEEKRIANSLVNDTAWSESHDEALMATFNNEPKYFLGTLAKYVEKFTNEMPIGKVIIPFTRISANVTNAMLEWTPFGFARYAFVQQGNPFKLWTEGRWKQDSDIAIRAILGTGTIFALLALMGKDDDDPDGFTVFGDGPRDLGKKRLLQEKGWKPNTIRIGGNYYSYLYTPLAMAFSIVGRQMDDYRDGKIATPGDVSLATTAVALMEAVKNQSFLATATDLMSAIDSPDPQSKVLKVLSRFASVPIPNVIKQMDRFIDPSLQDAKGFTESIIKEFPIARYALNPALNVFGEPINRTRGAIPIPGLERFVTADRMDDEVLNLISEKQVSIPGFSKSTRLGDTGMTEAQYYRYVQLAGPKIKERIRNELGALRMMSKETVEDRIQKISQEEKKKARQILVNE